MLPILADAVGSLVMGIINRFLPDTAQEKKDQLQAALQDELIKANLDIAQVQVDTAEAQSDNLFVAGWRPAVGWLCVAAMGYVYIIQPFVGLITILVGHPVTLPPIDIASLMPILLGMLGLGGLRTYEKVKGVSNGH